MVYKEGGRGGSRARNGRLANMQYYKEGGREAAGRVTVVWVCAKLVCYTSTLVAGGYGRISTVRYTKGSEMDLSH